MLCEALAEDSLLTTMNKYLDDITEDEFDRRVEQVKDASKRHERVSFAIGKSYENNRLDVRKALRTADERMYEDKRMYYEKQPEMKR